MAKFNVNGGKTPDSSPQKSADPAPVSANPNQAPQGVFVNDPKILQAVGDVVREKDPKADDPEMITHPKKDYTLADNSIKVDGKRQFMPDLLARHLNATMYFEDHRFDWGLNPLGGPPTPVYFTRYFPEKKVLYDNYDQKPDDKILAAKKQIAHEHGFRYLLQYPGLLLTPVELDKQLDVENAWLKAVGK